MLRVRVFLVGAFALVSGGGERTWGLLFQHSLVGNWQKCFGGRLHLEGWINVVWDILFPREMQDWKMDVWMSNKKTLCFVEPRDMGGFAKMGFIRFGRGS